MFGKRLTLIYWAVVVHIICSPIGMAQLDKDTIVGIWLFDEGKGETAKDISENGNHAKLVGAKWTDDYLDGFTYYLWIKPMRIPGGDHCWVIERNWHNPGIFIGPKDFFASIVSGGGMQPAVGQTGVANPKWISGCLSH